MTKAYVKVNVNIDTMGTIIPVYIVYDDVIYNIDKVLDIKQSPNLDAGGYGTRYTIRINGKVTYLWEEDGKYYVNQ